MADNRIIPTDRDKFRIETPSKFHEAIKTAKKSIATQSPEDSWRVDVHKPEEYNGDKLFVTEGGSCVAIEPNGNIISVCKNINSSDRGSDLIKKAIQDGGDRLDAFGAVLYNFYTKNGFEPVCYTPFNREYAPEDWKDIYGEEPVIFYRYTGKRTKMTYDEFIETGKKFEGTDGYENACRFRDDSMKKTGGKSE